MKRRNHLQHALLFTRRNMAQEMGEISDEQYEKMQQGIHLLQVLRCVLLCSAFECWTIVTLSGFTIVQHSRIFFAKTQSFLCFRHNNDSWLLFSYENLADLVVAIRESAANDDNSVAAARWWSTQKMRPPVDLRTPSRLSVTVQRENDSITIYRWQMKQADNALRGQLVTCMACSLDEFFAM